ncbi:MAG: hypothetical protein Q4B04_05405 [bacterium]|nr:hypothetical protein [bacterium]
MVKKLFKYEFLSYFKIMGIVYIVLLSIAAFDRISRFFESDSTIYSIVSGFSVATYVVTLFAVFVFSFLLIIIRFYKNFFTGEGYLSFTLPVSNTQHLLVKILTAIAIQILTVFVVLLSLCIITSGDALFELLKAGAYLLHKFYMGVGFNSVLYIFEALVLIIASVITQFLLYYACIAIGQLYNKNRILAAVGTYFVYYIIIQIITTIIVVFLSVYADNLLLFFEPVIRFMTEHPKTVVHIGLCGIILWELILSAVFFIVTRFILNKKLNLE